MQLHSHLLRSALYFNQGKGATEAQVYVTWPCVAAFCMLPATVGGGNDMQKGE
jgi:hypothetical protein